MDQVAALAGLFFAAFLAATLVPAQSETALAVLVLAKEAPVAFLVVVASLGNTLGSLVNWLIGRGIESYRHRRWFPVNDAMLERAGAWYGKFGFWSLLLSWAPVIGDPLTLVAGVLREPLWRFLLLVAIAKTGRYLLVAASASAFL